MNHWPFEDWLLDEQPLTVPQRRDLDAHLRGCAQCTSIAESNLSLRAARQIGPAAGFAVRFRNRLGERRLQQRWRQAIGTLVLVFAGLATLYWVAGATIAGALQSPSSWINASVGYGVSILTTLRALRQASSLLLRDMPRFVSPTGWSIMVAAGSGLGGAWIALMRQFARRPQGV